MPHTTWKPTLMCTVTMRIPANQMLAAQCDGDCRLCGGRLWRRSCQQRLQLQVRSSVARQGQFVRQTSGGVCSCTLSPSERHISCVSSLIWVPCEAALALQTCAAVLPGIVTSCCMATTAILCLVALICSYDCQGSYGQVLVGLKVKPAGAVWQVCIQDNRF